MRHEWHSPCCVLPFYFIFFPSLEVLTPQQKDPLLCLVVTSVCLFLTCNMIHISIHIKPGKLPLSEPTGLRAEISSLGNERSASGGQEKERRALQSCGMEWAAMQVTCMCYWETQSPWPGMQFFLSACVVMRCLVYDIHAILHLPFVPLVPHPPTAFVVLTSLETGTGFTLGGRA